ncbi:MAG: NAD(P)/FAD-dependent oxidoreductase [Pseudomonadota bacterium]
MNFAVVGGGITGLSIAYRLAHMGEKVALYERSSRVGGLAGSFRVGETRLEKYFHHIFLSDTAVRERIAKAKLGKDLLWRITPMGFYAGGKIHPFDGPFDLLRFPVLSPFDRFRLGRGIFKAGRFKDGLSLDSRTAKEWVERDWGGAVYERFWGPLLTSKFGDAADRISAAWLWGRIYARANSRTGTRERLGYLRGSFERLLDEMEISFRNHGGELRVHQDVKEVREGPGKRWRVSTEAGAEEYDIVVLAIPSPLILLACPGLPPDERKAHEAVRYAAINCMPILMDRPLSRIYWLNVGDRTIPFTGVIEQTNFLSPQEYGGNHVAYLFNYLPQGHPWLTEPKEKVFAIYEEGLRRLFPDYRRDQVKQILIFRDPYANVIYEANYNAKKPPIASAISGLFFANTAHIFPEDRNLNYSIELAEKVVGEIQRKS